VDPQLLYQEIQPELASREQVIWSGQPSPRVIFHAQDLFMIPFSLLWGGFAIFWEASVLGMFGTSGSRSSNPVSLFMALWGVPFVLVGQYFIWGRFLYVAWKKKHLIYAVTDKRVLVVSLGRNRGVKATALDQMPTIEKTVRRNGTGTLTFGIGPPLTGRGSTMGSWDGGLSSPVPTFVDVEEAENVYRMISDAREKALRKD
jgi:hypothetical protein